MVLVAIAWLVSAVYDSFVNTPKDAVQKLFDNEDKPKDR